MNPILLTIMIITVVVLFVLLVVRNEKTEYQKARKCFQASYGEPQKKTVSTERIRLISAYHKAQQNPFEVDDITWNDLDLSLLYEKLHYTLTEPGEALLYHYLRTPLFDEDELLKREKRVLVVHKNEDFRLALQMAFRFIGSDQKISLYDCIASLEQAPVPSTRRIMIRNLVPVLCVGGMFLNLPIFLILFFLSIAYNIRSYFVDKSKILPYLSSVIGVLRILEGGQKIAALSFPEELSEEKLRLCSSLSEMKAYMRGSFLLIYAAGAPSSSNPVDVLLEYLRMLFSIDLLKFVSMRKEAILHHDCINDIYTRLGELEAAVCIACYRQSMKNGYCIPSFSVGKEVTYECEGLYHPYLDEPVPNSFQTNSGILLTGSNASGKSTFLRSIGLSALMAQSIHTVAGQNYQSSFFRIYSSMSLKDDLISGDSYYMAEIKAIYRILSATEDACNEHQPVLCLVDEVLRGTNTAERIAASSQILKALSQSTILCFAATHDLELTELLSDYYQNFHFKEEIEGDDVRFSYKIMTGPADTRNAIKLLRMCHFPDELVTTSEQLAEQYVKNGLPRKKQ